MLEKERFDYIAISALDDTTAMGLTEHSTLTTLSDPMLYYPIPVQLHISSKKVALTQRLQKGLQLFINSGEAKKLIEEAFVSHSVLQGKAQVRLLVVTNPLYSEETNQQALKSFTAQFPDTFKLIHQ